MPLTPLSVFQVNRFGGINRRDSKFLIRDDQSQELLNFIFDEVGRLTKIPGYVSWNADVTAGRMLGGERFYKTGGIKHFFEAHNGNLYEGADGPKTFTTRATTLSSTATYRMKNFRDRLYIVNGVDANRKWNGSIVTLMGLVAPAGAATAAVGAAGAVTGTGYTWKVTFVSATMESNAGPASNSINLTAQRADLTSVPTSADGQVTARRIYRVLSGGTQYKFVGEIADNVTTTFTDNIADSGLGADVPVDKNVPPICTFIESFKSRLWLAGDANNPRRLYYSEVFEPEAWPALYFIDIPMVQGDEITAIKVLGDFLVIYGHTGIYMVFGDNVFEFVVRRSSAAVGCDSDRTIQDAENVHIYLTHFGVYAFDGATTRRLSEEVGPLLANINQSQVHRAAAGYHEKRKLYRLSVPTGAATENNQELILDIRTQQWTTTDRAVAHYHILNGPGDSGQLYTASNTIFRLYEDDTGTTADGVAIRSRWKSKAYTNGPIDYTKTYRHILLWFLATTTVFAVEARLDDSINSVQSFSFSSVTGVGSLYGQGQYGTAVYSGALLVRQAFPFGQHMIGRWIELTLEITTPAAFVVQSLEFSNRANTHLRIR
jgi:hypothetical protein